MQPMPEIDVSPEENATTGISGWRLDSSYARLPERFYARLPPARVASPGLVLFNRELAASLGLRQTGSDAELAQVFAGNRLPAGAQSLALAYAGHQFGYLNSLGDGRAHLLGEQIAPDGKRYDIQLKGSGRTPYSRNGDGRAALGPMLREYIISEAMHALGIPTTRSLAVATTGETVRRETPLAGAVLTRIAASHIRVGSFAFFAARQDQEGLRLLADYAIQRHFPDLADDPARYRRFLRSVVARQASLIAQWMSVGFIHGVMNTDNMTISGETIDYGPCAFLDAYDPATVFSSIDRQGRYAFGNQPPIAQWNLARFAEALLPLLDSDSGTALKIAEEEIGGFRTLFQQRWLELMRRKLGLQAEESGDAGLVQSFLDWMQQTGADYTHAFRNLASGDLAGDPAGQINGFTDWHARWMARLGRGGDADAAKALMRASNPALIPRNHLVEAALADAAAGHLATASRLLDALRTPFAEPPAFADLRQLPPSVDAAYRTFCGT